MSVVEVTLVAMGRGGIQASLVMARLAAAVTTKRMLAQQWRCIPNFEQPVLYHPLSLPVTSTTQDRCPTAAQKLRSSPACPPHHPSTYHQLHHAGHACRNGCAQLLHSGLVVRGRLRVRAAGRRELQEPAGTRQG